MRTLLIAVTALLATAGMAAAQVAAPSLNPTPSATFSFQTVLTPFVSQVPFNPAVLTWDGPSRIALVYGSAKVDDVPTSTTVLKGNVTGVLAEAVGEMFAGRIQSVSASQDVQSTPGAVKNSGQQIGVAAQFGKQFSIGVGAVKEAFDFTAVGGTDVEESSVMPGVTLRLGEMIYLGASGGTATVKDKTAGQDAKRSVMQYGIAFMRRDKDSGVHVEVYKSKRDSSYFPGGVALATLESNVTGGTIEFQFSRILFGYAAQTDKVTDPSGVAPETDKLSTLTIGYNAGQGLAVVLSRSSSESTDDTLAQADKKFVTSTLGVAWQF